MGILKKFGKRKKALLWIEPEEFMHAQSSFLTVDVREEEEWNRGHIRNALWFPTSTFIPQALHSAISAEKRFPIFYCNMGGRSSRAAEAFLKAFPNYEGKIYVLNGGLSRFKDSFSSCIEKQF